MDYWTNRGDFPNSIVVRCHTWEHVPVLTTGAFRDTADFDPGSGTYNLISSGGNDIFVSKLDSFGNFSLGKKHKWQV